MDSVTLIRQAMGGVVVLILMTFELAAHLGPPHLVLAEPNSRIANGRLDLLLTVVRAATGYTQRLGPGGEVIKIGRLVMRCRQWAKDSGHMVIPPARQFIK